VFQLETIEATAEDAASGFSCGDRDLDRYFAKNAVSNALVGISTAYVLRGAPPNQVCGFYCLSMGTLASAQVQPFLETQLPRYPMGAALLGRFAVAEQLQGRGEWGPRLLVDAFKRVCRAAEDVGCVGIHLHAKSERAARFYERYGFSRLEANTAGPQVHMFVPLRTVREAARRATSG
jgi:GNAT superfamily N-acetyltransferase